MRKLLETRYEKTIPRIGTLDLEFSLIQKDNYVCNEKRPLIDLADVQNYVENPSEDHPVNDFYCDLFMNHLRQLKEKFSQSSELYKFLFLVKRFDKETAADAEKLLNIIETVFIRFDLQQKFLRKSLSEKEKALYEYEIVKDLEWLIKNDFRSPNNKETLDWINHSHLVFAPFQN